jgi:hypothetical protein
VNDDVRYDVPGGIPAHGQLAPEGSAVPALQGPNGRQVGRRRTPATEARIAGGERRRRQIRWRAAVCGGRLTLRAWASAPPTSDPQDPQTLWRGASTRTTFGAVRLTSGGHYSVRAVAHISPVEQQTIGMDEDPGVASARFLSRISAGSVEKELSPRTSTRLMPWTTTDRLEGVWLGSGRRLVSLRQR